MDVSSFIFAVVHRTAVKSARHACIMICVGGVASATGAGGGRNAPGKAAARLLSNAILYFIYFLVFAKGQYRFYFFFGFRGRFIYDPPPFI